MKRFSAKQKLFAVFFVVLSFCLFLFSQTKTARTLRTVYYFTKSGLASEKSRAHLSKRLPSFQKIQYPDGKTTSEAWLFTPKNSHSHSAVILSPGIGLTDETNILIANTGENLSKAGITVLVPFPEDVAKNLITGSVIESYKNAFIFLENQSNVDKSKIGFIGFCVGSDFSLLAAANPQISNNVSFVASFAAYSDLSNYFAEIISGKTPGVASRVWYTFPSVHSIAVDNLIYGVSSENDRQLLKEMFEEGGSLNLQSKLTQEGQKAFAVLNSKDSNFIKNNLSQINETGGQNLYYLSPINFVNQIKAPVYLFHEKNDPFEPVEESRSLSHAFGARAKYFETDLLDHTVLQSNISLSTWLTEGPKMFGFLYQIFSKTS